MTIESHQRRPIKATSPEPGHQNHVQFDCLTLDFVTYTHAPMVPSSGTSIPTMLRSTSLTGGSGNLGAQWRHTSPTRNTARPEHGWFFTHGLLSACTLQPALSAEFETSHIMRIAMTRALPLYYAHPQTCLQAWFDNFVVGICQKITHTPFPGKHMQVHAAALTIHEYSALV